MIQQLIALALIAIFIWRLADQKRRQKLGRNEFIFWLTFWLLGALAVIFIRQIDDFVTALGFSSGINLLLYLTVMFLFYLVLKLRLTIAKLDANLTEIARTVALRRDDTKQ